MMSGLSWNNVSGVEQVTADKFHSLLGGMSMVITTFYGVVFANLVKNI